MARLRHTGASGRLRALSRNELAELEIETIQQREGRSVLIDLEGKGWSICDNLTRILAGDELVASQEEGSPQIAADD